VRSNLEPNAGASERSDPNAGAQSAQTRNSVDPSVMALKAISHGAAAAIAPPTIRTVARAVHVSRPLPERDSKWSSLAIKVQERCDASNCLR
jgi:hypothetical protein